jgi:hypothetical protein
MSVGPGHIFTIAALLKPPEPYPRTSKTQFED